MNLVTIDRAYRVHIETFGCQMNEYDTELVRSLLKARGFTFTEDRERADVVRMLAERVGHASAPGAV
ncbi:MAG: hypothetical protein AAB049_07825, partial [Nitrospirota bacterium]